MKLLPMRIVDAIEYEQNLPNRIGPDQIIDASRTDAASEIMSLYTYFGKKGEGLEAKYVKAAMQVISFSEGSERRAVLVGEVASTNPATGVNVHEIVDFRVHPNGTLFKAPESDDDAMLEGYLTYSDNTEQRQFIEATVATLTE